jgi:hypothetical protein
MFPVCYFNNVCTFERNKFFMNSHILYRVFKFYVDGFRSMTVGKTLWMIIGIKLFIMFVVLKLFFFPDFLKSNFDNDSERSEYVIEQLTK